MANFEISETGIAEDERIAALEKNLRAMESRVKVLIDELLDFKAVARTMSRQQEEYGEISPVSVLMATPMRPAAAPSDARAIILQDARQSFIPVAPAAPGMVRIMQADGTMKMEPRYGDAKTH
jgi:hypothetical protein